MFLGWKNHYCGTVYTNKYNVQIHLNPYQITNGGIFHRIRAKFFTVYMETQKTLNSKNSLENEEWNWRNQPSLNLGYTTKLQSSR